MDDNNTIIKEDLTLKNHVIAVIQPFVLLQNVYVYREGECLKAVNCSLEEINNICYALCREYDIHNLDLIGVKDYIVRIKNEMSNLTNYQEFNIKITLN